MAIGMTLEDAAAEYGRRVAVKLFEGRKGHGGGPCSRRVLGPADLAAIAAAAFQAGATVAKRKA